MSCLYIKVMILLSLFFSASYFPPDFFSLKVGGLIGLHPTLLLSLSSINTQVGCLPKPVKYSPIFIFRLSRNVEIHVYLWSKLCALYQINQKTLH